MWAKEGRTDLDRDVTRSDDGDPLGLRLELKEAVRRDTVLGTLNVGERGRSSDGDEDVLCVERVRPSVGRLDLKFGGALEGRVPLVLVDVVLLEVALVDAVQSLDVGVSLVLERRPVERDRLVCGGVRQAGYAESERVSVPQVLGDAGSVPHDLRDTQRAGKSMLLKREL